MRFRPTTFAALACCLLSGLLPAQQETAAFPENEALSAAIAVETLERDLQRAAELYREVAESADGSVAPSRNSRLSVEVACVFRLGVHRSRSKHRKRRRRKFFFFIF